jgi:hypothetical protein
MPFTDALMLLGWVGPRIMTTILQKRVKFSELCAPMKVPVWPERHTVYTSARPKEATPSIMYR